MTAAKPFANSMGGIARLVRTDRDAILAAWTKRIAGLPASHLPSLAPHGTAVLAWLAQSLADDVHGAETAQELPTEVSFSSPRAIAELVLLAEMIERLRAPGPADDAEVVALHRVIDTAVAKSLARDANESEHLRKRLRLATDLTLVGCWELAAGGIIVEADPRSRELFGIAEAERGEPATLEALTASLHDDDRERVREGIAKTLKVGEPYMDDCRTQRVDAVGVRWVAIAADVHEGVGSDSRRVLGIVHDVTVRKRAEENHARVVEELSRAVHISEMFVGILSHDLRNPLSTMLGGASLLGKQSHDEKSARIAALVVSSGERMGRMIDQLLDFTRARLGEGIALQRGPTDLADLARSAVDEANVAKPAALLHVNQRGDTSGAWDRDRISQVLSNLVGNALEHGLPSGAIDIIVDGTVPDRVRLSIANQGAIPAHLLPVIFNPFRGTLQKQGRSNGLGLGLYVARQIALAHGGELEVESTATTTAFRLTLPRSEPQPVSTRQDFVREEELAAFERMAAPPSTSAVTAQLFGATPLRERAPLEYSDIVEAYGGLLETALHRKAYRGQGEGLASDLRGIAERLGNLGAGPREVTDVHARALRVAVRGVTAARTQALLSEGRLLALELMGNLAGFYRRRSRGQGQRA